MTYGGLGVRTAAGPSSEQRITRRRATVQRVLWSALLAGQFRGVVQPVRSYGAKELCVRQCRPVAVSPRQFLTSRPTQTAFHLHVCTPLGYVSLQLALPHQPDPHASPFRRPIALSSYPPTHESIAARRGLPDAATEQAPGSAVDRRALAGAPPSVEPPWLPSVRRRRPQVRDPASWHLTWAKACGFGALRHQAVLGSS